MSPLEGCLWAFLRHRGGEGKSDVVPATWRALTKKNTPCFFSLTAPKGISIKRPTSRRTPRNAALDDKQLRGCTVNVLSGWESPVSVSEN